MDTQKVSMAEKMGGKVGRTHLILERELKKKKL